MYIYIYIYGCVWTILKTVACDVYPHNITIKIVKQNDYNDVKPMGRYILRTYDIATICRYRNPSDIYCEYNLQEIS